MDKDTFCEQIRLHEKAMYDLAFSLVRNDTDAADIISEAILRAYKNLNSLKSKKAFKTWILKIILNTAVEYIRKNTRIIPIQEVVIAGEFEETDTETKLTVWQAVNTLKEPYRTDIILYYYEDLRIDEIAKITNTNAIVTKQHLSRARKKLREILKEDFAK